MQICQIQFHLSCLSLNELCCAISNLFCAEQNCSRRYFDFSPIFWRQAGWHFMWMAFSWNVSLIVSKIKNQNVVCCNFRRGWKSQSRAQTQQNNRKSLLALYIRLDYSEGIKIFPALDTEPRALFSFTLLYTVSMPPCKMVFSWQSCSCAGCYGHGGRHFSRFAGGTLFHSNTKFGLSCDRRKAGKQMLRRKGGACEASAYAVS